ncbi:MAG: ABC transporter substrate-binding protein [Chloroflexi bacterium]|nr:ABC transporter substrate-binding protein [Chloroflexota bacterium]
MGPTFSTWEERSGGPDHVIDPVGSFIVQNKTWWTDDHLKKARYFELYPELAKSWEQSADGLKWTFKFREGVKWSDGKPLACPDAQWSLDTIRTGLGLKQSPAAPHLRAISKIECSDDLTMVITMKQPKSGLLSVIGLPNNVVRPKHVYDGNTDKMRNEAPSVVSGPFQVKEYIAGEKATVARRPDYWDQPFPYLDGIEVLIMTNQAMDAGLRAGRLDYGGTGYAGPRLKTLREGCKDCVFSDSYVNPSLLDAVMINHQRSPWNDPLVMDAISYAIDRVKLNKLVYLGENVLARGGPFVPGSGWDMPYERVKTIPGYNFEDPEGNKQKARELLAKAGYKPGELKTTLDVWSPIQAAGPPLLEDLQQVGINVDLRILESGKAYEIWSAGEFNIGVHGFFYVTSDPDEVLYEHFYTGSNRNYNRYSNLEVDRLIDQMSTTADPELRKKRAWDVAEIIMREQGKILTSSGVNVAIQGPRLRGWAPAPGWMSIAGPGLRLQHVWLEGN